MTARPTRVAILSESPLDETVLRVLVAAVLGGAVEVPPNPRLATRSWPKPLDNLGVVIRHLHYRQPDTDGLVVAADSDESSINEAGPHNRLVMLRERRDATLAQLPSLPGRRPLRVAVGVAVPMIDAWLLAPEAHEVGEAGWENGLLAGRFPYQKRLLKD